MFTFLVFLAAFALEAIGSYVSIVGLSALFAANVVVIVLAGCLDFAKIVGVSFLYKNWKDIGLMMKSYLTIAMIVLMTITSAGAFGFLSGEFQKAIADTGTQAIKIQTLDEEKTRLQKRKEEIDAQIAKLPTNNVRGRTQLMKQFGPEITRLNDRLAVIDRELPELKIQNVDKETHVGPIMYVSKAFDVTPEKAVTWVILSIIFVFDPLAVALLIAGNFLLDKRKKPIEPEVKEELTPAQIMAILDQPREEPVEQPVEQPVEPPKEDKVLPFVEDPDCKYCGDHGELHVGPGQYIDCEACTPAIEEEIAEEPALAIDAVEPPPEEVVEPVPEEVAAIDDTPTPPLKLERHIKVEEREGREVISLENVLPKSSLEGVSVKLADIELDDKAASKLTMKLRNYYSDDNTPAEPVIVGGPKT